LTVLREVVHTLPQEDTVYFGDTARVPYGTKSPETVMRYSSEIASFLLKRDIKLLVVACNTASAVALPSLKRQLSIPVVGVIEPGARRAVEVTRSGRIGVIGTAGTIRSSAYTRAIKRLMPEAEVLTRACPLFVPLAEEGWTDNQVARLTAQSYLQELKDSAVDTLVLGCTHYPLLKPLLQRVMGPEVRLIDSGEETAAVVAHVLDRNDLRAPEGAHAEHRFAVSDDEARFRHVGARFIGERLGRAEVVPLD